MLKAQGVEMVCSDLVDIMCYDVHVVATGVESLRSLPCLIGRRNQT